MNRLMKILMRARKSSDVVLAVAMAAVLGALIIPLPPWLLDLGLAINLAAAVALLVAALYARDALKVTSFPTLLLFTTLFRLALNVSSTRLALAEGHAGEVIQAFGEFVVRGDYVVGAVIFAILTLVQFLVVAKGAERVAEVSARFTLDAMPGKQMSIDADLRAGAIDQAQARAPAPQPGARVADVRRHGWRDEVREGRRHRRSGHRRGEPPGRHLHRRPAERDDDGRCGLHLRPHRHWRRAGVADSLPVHRGGGGPCRHAGGLGEGGGLARCGDRRAALRRGQGALGGGRALRGPRRDAGDAAPDVPGAGGGAGGTGTQPHPDEGRRGGGGRRLGPGRG